MAQSAPRYVDRHIAQKVQAYLENPAWIFERAGRIRKIRSSELVWIFGVGRSGSTWFTEMLDGLHNTRVWHEPYFGSLLSHPASIPAEFERRDCFFANDYKEVWYRGLRDLMLINARARFGRISKGTRIVIKDIKSWQLCPHFPSIFPDSRFILLVRDPYDVLDSHIDMAKPGAWNENQATPEAFATYIRECMEQTLVGYRLVRDDLRLLVKYGDLVEDPVGQMKRCVEFMRMPTTSKELEETVERNRFESHGKTGAGQFRRFGKPGIWRTSGHFTPAVLEVAERILGDLRSELGY